MRVEGKFVDAEGNKPEGQLVRGFLLELLEGKALISGHLSFFQVLLYLLRRCYGLCYRLMASSEPISEELMPIANVRQVVSSFQLLFFLILTSYPFFWIAQRN